MKKFLGVTVVALLLFSACSDSGNDGSKINTEEEKNLNKDEQAIADMVAAELISVGHSIIMQEDGDCVGEKFVEGFGVERLEELGVTAEDASAVFGDDPGISEKEKEITINLLKDCVGAEKMFAASVRSVLAENDDAECIASKIDDDTLEKLLEEEKDSKFSTEVNEAAEDCGVDLTINLN